MAVLIVGNVHTMGMRLEIFEAFATSGQSE